MTQENKELLFKDLCSRLPYGVKLSIETYDEKRHKYKKCIGKLFQLNFNSFWVYEDDFERFIYSEENNKPYLFPLSSMTEEQKKEISKRYNYYNLYQLCVEITNHREGYWDEDNSCNLQDYLWLEDWFNKNHFDYRGLIPKGLAIDATGLNIY